MKVKLLPLAVTAAIAMPGLALADGPTVYGKLNVSFDNVKYDFGYDLSDGADSSSTNWQVNSNASRFGVKGDAAINSKLKATYLIEWGVDATGDNDNDTAKYKTFTNRNRSVGLAGDFGALDVGQFDTPTKTAQGKVDQFNDMAGDLAYVLIGDVRATNIIQYTSPMMSGLQAKLAVMPGEQFDDGTADTKDAKDGPADAISASVSYAQGPIYVALALDQDLASSTYVNDAGGIGKLDGDNVVNPYTLTGAVSDNMDTVRLIGQYTAGAVAVGAIYQQSELHDSDPGEKFDQDGFLLSAAYTMGQTVLKAQYVQSTDDVGSAELDTKSWSLGVDQKLSAQTLVGAYYTALTFEWDYTGSETQEKDVLGAYISHSF